ncbi:conjugal transfer protein TrbJ (plasmid) [Variovorax sp. SRS16]|nr:conjugal transfer protein TrbJ [Variovorax sp. SRS16]
MRKLVARATTLVALCLAMGSSCAGIPTIDITNVIQNTITASEEVAQTAKQIEQYKTQLDQYENMLKNTAAPAAYVWDKAQSTMSSLRSAIDTYAYYKNQLGSIDSYLAKFQNTNYYKSSPCFQPTGCSAAEWAKLKGQQAFASEAQKRSNDAMMRGLDKQQEALDADARQLERLQSSAQTADGQMKAIQNASMIAANSGNQLLQIRGLLIAQQNAMATRMQAQADAEALRAAADAKQTGGSYVRTTPMTSW